MVRLEGHAVVECWRVSTANAGGEECSLRYMAQLVC